MRILDTLFRDALSRTSLKEHENVELIRGDVCDRAIVAKAMAGVTHVVHLAAIAGVDTVLSKPTETMKVALTGTMNILEEASKNDQIERVVDFSTSEVFGVYAYKVNEGKCYKLRCCRRSSLDICSE